MKRAFVTGASGFIGSAVVRALLADGVEVRVLMREDSDRTTIEGRDVETVTGDLKDIRALGALLAKQGRSVVIDSPTAKRGNVARSTMTTASRIPKVK